MQIDWWKVAFVLSFLHGERLKNSYYTPLNSLTEKKFSLSCNYWTLIHWVEESLTWQECQLKELLKSYTSSGEKKFFEKLARWSCWGPKAWFCKQSSRKRKFEKWVGHEIFFENLGGSRIFFFENLGGSWNSPWNFGWVLKFTLKFWVGHEKFSDFWKCIPAPVD